MFFEIEPHGHFCICGSVLQRYNYRAIAKCPLVQIEYRYIDIKQNEFLSDGAPLFRSLSFHLGGSIKQNVDLLSVSIYGCT